MAKTSMIRSVDKGPDPAIADSIRAGEYRNAVAGCAREYGDALGRFCMALLGSQADAEEAVQDTLIAAHSAMATYRGDGSVKAWLFTIARRKCARQWQARKRRERPVLAVVDAPPETPDASLLRSRRAVAVRAALMDLKPTEREAVVLRYQAGLDYKDIARVCDIGGATARKRVSRGLANLRKNLHREDME